MLTRLSFSAFVLVDAREVRVGHSLVNATCKTADSKE